MQCQTCTPHADDQLYKDVEGALEYAHDGLASALKSANGSNGSGNGNGLSDSTLLQVGW